MRLGVFDILRRGVDNTIANWQVALIRFAESVLFGILAIVAVLVTVIPILVSIGIHLSSISSPEDVQSAMFTMMDKWVILLWILLGFGLLLGIFILIHSFVEAGIARVLVDADRAAGRALDGPRQRYRVFSMQRWVAGAKDGWWDVFWIYNIAWGVGGLILLIPLIPLLIIILAMRENPGPAVAVGCIGLVLFTLFAIVVAIFTGMWCQRAIAEWAVRDESATDSLAASRHAVRADLGRHFLVALSIFVVAIAGSTVFSSFSMFAAFGDSMSRHAAFSLATLPIRFAGSLLSSAFSALIATWYLASYSALAVEGMSSRA